MSAIPIPQRTIDAVMLDWRMGKGSQRQIADRYKISAGKVAGLTKGVERDIEPIVSAGVEYKQDLANYDERIVSAVLAEVDERTKHIQFFNDATVRNLSTMIKKVGADTSIMEHRIAQAAIKDGRETVLGKTPETAVQINNSMAVSWLDNES